MKPFEQFSSARAGAFGGLCWALLLIGCGGYLVSSLIPAGVGPSSAQAATPVIDSSAARDAAGFVTRAIEEVQPGDRVLSREEGDAAAPVRPRRVEAVFRRTADHLRLITVRTALGREQTLQTTDNHPFWVPGQGWVEAGKLKSGQSVTILDGASATVASTTREEHPLGIEVYNFRVEGSHTYFASAANSTGPPVWVHNASCGLTGISVRGVPLDGYAAEKTAANEGIYEFTAASGKQYVGQTGNFTNRIAQHLADEKLLPGDLGTVQTTEVLGGKTAREVAEQLGILQRGGVENLENIRNPIGPARANLLPQWTKDLLGYK